MRILTAATAWGSTYGGVNVFNYRLSCALARIGHDVTVLVKCPAPEDSDDARKNNISLLKSKSENSAGKWKKEDVGYIYNIDFAKFDIIVFHDIVCLPIIEYVRRTYKSIPIISFLHTMYEQTEYFGPLTDAERYQRIQDQINLVKDSDLVFTSGNWLKNLLSRRLAGDQDALAKLRAFVPGRSEGDISQISSDNSITAFGRLSFSKDEKQTSAIVEAFALLCDDFRNKIFDGDMPQLNIIGINLTHAEQQEYKKIFRDRGYTEPVLRFFEFESYFDFQNSTTHKLLSTSRLALTPSLFETFGLASLEAASIGVPLITGRQSGFYNELVRLMPKRPEYDIEWIEVPDFTSEKLPHVIAGAMRNILRKYDFYRNGARIIADGILSMWPTWEHSALEMISEVKFLSKPASWSSETKEPTGNEALAKLAALKPILSDARPQTAKAQVSAPDRTGNVQAPRAALLLEFFQMAYGVNAVDIPALAQKYASKFGGKECTELQRQLLTSIMAAPVHPFQDILMCGGTSSGKTTAAEILFGISNGNDIKSTRIIYLAPTRALAQERWREWKETFRSVEINRTPDPVIISTGEDHSSDRALARGDYLIACLVFEKANVLLTASPELLSKTTLVVIDELHMIADIHRGPLIESLVAKLKYEKRRRLKRDGARTPLRMIGITTEPSALALFEKYLATYDFDKDQFVFPLVVKDIGRPREVRHFVVQPESHAGLPFKQDLLATFASDEPVTLSEDQISDFVARSNARSAAPAKQRLYDGEGGKKLKHIDKYLYFIENWLQMHPLGRRLLVFIGSKADQLNLANRLQAQIKTSHTLLNREYFVERLSGVLEELKNDDTSVGVDILTRSVSRGVFVHNADISRSLRFAMEEYLRGPLPQGSASEVIIATETLSYGVNLAIDDVGILSLEFPASERNQEFGATPTRLSRCAFNNMCGRAGRLNQKSDVTASVYIWPITGQELSIRMLASEYYTDNGASLISSKIVHGEDKEAYDKIKTFNRQSRAPLLLTYPFTKCVLDGLKFAGGAPGLSGATRRSDTTFEEIGDEFIRHLMYFYEHGENVKDIERLRECVEFVIDAAMDPAFELVQRSGRGYKITQLGSSIIDTGTEISTLEPLKSSLHLLLRIWHETGLELPVEALLLPIIVQNEAHRQVIASMPEVRGVSTDEKNRPMMLAWLVEKFAGLGFPPECVAQLDAFLLECDLNPRHAPISDATSREVHDGCLRLFCGLLMWVSGNTISQTQSAIGAIGHLPGRKLEIATNFATLADRISWKLAFLTNLLRYSKLTGDTRLLQTKARRLVTRLQLGCAEDALPFLVRSGNEKSEVSRRIAHELLGRGATAKAIGGGAFELDSYPMGLQASIRRQIRRFMTDSFARIKDEFVYSSSTDDDICRNYWEYANTVVRRFAEGNNDLPSWSRDGGTTQTYDPAPGSGDDDLKPMITIERTNEAIRIVITKLQWEEDRKVSVDAVRWFVRPRHTIKELPAAPPGFSDIAIDFPWLLDQEPAFTNQIRFSPAAFGIVLTLLTRSFLRDPAASLSSIGAGRGSVNTFDLMDALYSDLVMPQFPDALFDAWASYWDAD